MSAEQTMIDNLEKNYGHPLSYWIEIVHKSGKEKHKEIIDYLKSEFGFTYGFANLVAHKSKKSDAASVSKEVDLIELQYSNKENLLPIYEKIMEKLKPFGNIEIAPKKSYVSLRGSKQFALIQPSTKTRLDVGLNFSDKEPTDRLELSGSFNSMCSHRVRLSSDEDVDDELIGWLKSAYTEAK